MDAHLHILKTRLDTMYGLKSVLKLYDFDEKYVTLHYFSPQGMEMFYLAFRHSDGWQFLNGQWSGFECPGWDLHPQHHWF